MIRQPHMNPLSKLLTRPLATILFAACLLTGCISPRKSESLSVTGIYFDTVIKVEAWGTQRSVLNHCEELCKTYENLLSPTIETSDVSRINAANGSSVKVSEDTAELIKLGIKYSELSDGKFDITVASAERLWQFNDNKEKVLPDPVQLADAVSHIDYHCIQVEGTTVTLTDPDARIDLGGIAKGYIADKLKEYLQSENVKHALINLGGNMLALGGKYDDSDFLIGIQKPFAEEGTLLGSIRVSDKSVVTSGNYERYFEKDGIIYHHILDPETGYPVQNNLYQVTILSDRSTDGDALSTACYILGLEKGMELIRSIDGAEAIFVTNDDQILTSDSSITLTPAM